MKGMSVLAAVAMVLMVHAWGGSPVRVSPPLSCEPDCSGVSDDVKVADPNNCTVFYYCSSGVPYGPVPCPSGHFDPDAAECVAGEGCDPICGSAGGNCPLTCYEGVGFVGDAFNCTVYYLCNPSGLGGPYKCPEDRPHYNANSNTCVNDSTVCCHGYCQPYCDGSGAYFVPDPNDCTKCYVCGEEEGIPGESNHLTCSDGWYWSVQVGECVEGPVPDPCPTLCDAARGAKKF